MVCHSSGGTNKPEKPSEQSRRQFPRISHSPSTRNHFFSNTYKISKSFFTSRSSLPFFFFFTRKTCARIPDFYRGHFACSRPQKQQNKICKNTVVGPSMHTQAPHFSACLLRKGNAARVQYAPPSPVVHVNSAGDSVPRFPTLFLPPSRKKNIRIQMCTCARKARVLRRHECVSGFEETNSSHCWPVSTGIMQSANTFLYTRIRPNRGCCIKNKIVRMLTLPRDIVCFFFFF